MQMMFSELSNLLISLTSNLHFLISTLLLASGWLSPASLDVMEWESKKGSQQLNKDAVLVRGQSLQSFALAELAQK